MIRAIGARGTVNLRSSGRSPNHISLIDLGDGDITHYMLAMVHHDRLAAILERVLDTEQFLSPHGVRKLSKYHRDHPYVYHLDERDYSVDYTPATVR